MTGRQEAVGATQVDRHAHQEELGAVAGETAIADPGIAVGSLDRFIKTNNRSTDSGSASARHSSTSATPARGEERGLEYILGTRERADGLVRELVLADNGLFTPLLIERAR
jgi:hypothetical protein